jgi:hypothetical protein
MDECEEFICGRAHRSKKVKNTTSLFLSLSVAVLLVLVGWARGYSSYEESLIRIELKERGLLSPEVESSPIEAQALLAKYGMEAYIAERKYPGKAAKIYGLYGEEREFQEDIDRHGPTEVVPIIGYFLEHESLAMEAQAMIGCGTSILRESFAAYAKLARCSESLSPEQRGWLAVLFIHDDGHDFLGQFAVRPDGTVVRLQVQRVASAVKSFLAGHMFDLEKKYGMGETVLARDWALAGAEAALLIMGGKGILSLIGRHAAKAKLASSGMKMGVWAKAKILAPKVLGSRIVRWGTAGAVGYLLVRHPAAFHSLVGIVAESIGLPAWFLQGLAWTVISFVLFTLLHPVWRVAKGTMRLARLVHKRA